MLAGQFWRAALTSLYAEDRFWNIRDGSIWNKSGDGRSQVGVYLAGSSVWREGIFIDLQYLTG